MMKDRDVNIYNDKDFYGALLSDFLKTNDNSAPDPNEGQPGNSDYLYGADLSLTQKYLLKRQKLKELDL